jgi:sialate O-acetylesterase
VDSDRKWRVKLPPQPPSDEGRPFTVRGNNTIKFDDIVVGDVWLAAGQSNMEFGLQIADGGKEAISTANDRSIRLFLVPYATSLTPQADINAVPPAALEGKWQVCSPDVLGARWGSNGFSAIGYFFARELRATTRQPIGVIGSYRGGSAAQAWTSVDGLQRDPRLGEFVKRHQQWVAGYADAAKAYPAKQSEYAEALSKWEREVRPTFINAMEAWNAAVKEAGTKGKTPPPKPTPSAPRPLPPIPPDGGYFGPGNLFNGMVAPLIPYAMKGVIWYQGEANTSTLAQALQYEMLFGRLITDWREKWKQGDFPFIYVQLPGYQPQPNLGLGNWVWLRESQAKVLRLPNTAMASAIDLGNPLDAHPIGKMDVARRLVLAARKLAYGEAVVASGPAYSSMKGEGGKIRLKFDGVGGGLKIGSPPWLADGVKPRDTTRLSGFTIAAEDRQFVPAVAVLDGDDIVVSSDAIPKPVAVRYNWADVPEGNLYNQEGLPALPFRTDAWEPTNPSTAPDRTTKPAH